MGSKGGSAPKPDPAIGQAAQANAAIAREALDFSKLQYAEGKGRQAWMDDLIEQVVSQQLRIGNKQEAASDDYLNYMKSTFRPIEQDLAKEAMEFDTEARRAELAGKAAADVEQAAAVSDASARREAARLGINPADAAFSENLAGSSLNKAIMKVGAMGQARTAARTEGRALKFDAAGLGRNLAGAGTTAASVALNAGNSAVGNSTTGAANARADAGLRLQGMNTAVGANQSAGGLYQGIFDAKMRGYEADANATSGLFQGLGTLGGAAIMMSSKRKKIREKGVNVEKVADKVKTLPVDRWRYKKSANDDRAAHVGPYAEDFKKRFGVGDGENIHVIDAVGVTLAAVKGVAQKVDKLEGKVARLASRGVRHG